MVLGLVIGIFYLLWDFVYWAKWLACTVGLHLKKRTQHRRFDLYDFDAENEPEKLGIVVPKEERILESPFPEEHLQHAADEVFIYGVNSKSEALVVRVSRSCNDEAEASVNLKLSDGQWYELDKNKGYQRNFGGKCTAFTCGGLQMYHMAAMRKWRIVYSGMLRERNPADGKKRKSVFVKFTFIWTASSDVFDAKYDLNIGATADAMARAKWDSWRPPIDSECMWSQQDFVLSIVKMVKYAASKTLNFYSQSGVLDGLVSIEDEPDIEMYLYGERMRYLGEASNLVGGKFKHVMGVVPESGLVLHVVKAFIPNIFNNLHFGFIVHPSSNVYTIKDALVISRMSGDSETGKNLTAMFKADKQYELVGNFSEKINFIVEPNWPVHIEMLGINFEVDGCKGSGIMIAGEISQLPENFNQRKIEVSPPLPLSQDRPLTVYFTDKASYFTELTGGKGSSLGKLTKLSREMKSEFTVPRGIIVTTAAYDEFLTPQMIDKVENLKNVAYGNIKGDIHQACKIVQHEIERAYLPDKITKEIEQKLNKLFEGRVNQNKVAVRSSATGEDTDQMSAAGQMDTFLGVQGLKEIFTAVKKCWASQFSYVAVEYKRQNGQILNSPMAVVIQEMVECESAGVLFTCDPVTNNPSIIAITGNYGLGESVVSGSEEPDTIILKKLPDGDVEINSKTVGLKQHRIVLTVQPIKYTQKISDTRPSEDEEGTVTEDVPEEKRHECCISEEMAIKLGKLSLKIEDYFKSPRDIEWGIKNNSIYMLQSRPITTGSAVSDYEIKHEFDGPVRCEGEFYTVSNVGEVMPGATSPLGVDVAVKYFSAVFQRGSLKKKQRNQFSQSKYYQNGLLTFYNHMHMSATDIITRVGESDSVMSQSFMVGVFGRILDLTEFQSVLKHREEQKPTQTKLSSILTQLEFYIDMFFSGRGVEDIKEKVFKYHIPTEKGKTAKEIFDISTHCSSHIADPFEKHITCTEMSSFWNMLLFRTLAESKGSVDNDVYSDFAKLLASSANVESADVPSAMQELAQTIVKHIKGEEFRAMTVEEAHEWLETSTSLAGCKYRQFIKRHGHRCLKEFDVYSTTWTMDPNSLVRLLQKMSGSCEEVKEKKEAQFSDILPHLTVPLNLKSKWLLKFVLPQCRRGVRERENCKSNLIKSMDNIRKGFRHLSKAMVAEGYLPDADLMFFLTVDEIREVLETRNPRLIARATHRRKLFPAMDKLLFPEISKNRPVPINEKKDEEIEYEADLTMKGIPVSQGVAKGYARVALTLEEAAGLKRGEILITHSTDIGWSPYFPILAGVVTELGGLISHGAVVSREYGLPCVVGLHGATRQFVTGDYVLLDGNKGILQRLSPPEN